MATIKFSRMIYSGNQCKLPLLNHVVGQNKCNGYVGNTLNNIDVCLQLQPLENWQIVLVELWGIVQVLKDVLVLKINLKKTALRLLPEAERWQKIFIVNNLMARQTFISAHGLDLHQVQGKNEITTKFIKNTGQNVLSILLLKNFKMGPSRFSRQFLQEPQKLRRIHFFKRKHRRRVFFETALKHDQNCIMLLKHWRVVLHLFL